MVCRSGTMGWKQLFSSPAVQNKVYMDTGAVVQSLFNHTESNTLLSV